MFYDERPRTPSNSPENLENLRGLWRPEAQAKFQNVLDRPDDYDPQIASLSSFEIMYVIPPAIVEPLQTELDQDMENDAVLFDQVWGDSVDEKRIHGAKRFLDRFEGIRSNIFQGVDEPFYGIEANFTPRGKPVGAFAAGQEIFPAFNCDAQFLERRLFHLGGWRTSPDMKIEGPLGWSVPVTEAGTEKYVESMIRIKNNLVPLHWLHTPGEMLRFTFKYPQLSPEGEAFLDDFIKANVELVPQDVTHDQMYDYHATGYGRRWANTSETRADDEQRYRRNHDEWRRSEPRRPI